MLLSIITVNLNDSVGLRKTIESVISQTFDNYEYIVIDGGSTDGSVEVINLFEKNITHWVSENDNGIYNAMNKGIQFSKGEYILFLNSNDCLVDNTILFNIFEKGYTEDILYGSMNVWKSGELIGLATTPDTISLRTLFEGTIHHQAAFIKKELFDRYGLYLEHFKICSDLEFWIRAVIINNCSTRFLDLIVSDFDMGGITGNMDYEALTKQEKTDIFNSFFPKRILDDYEAYIKIKRDFQILFWAHSKAYINSPIQLFYRIASKFLQWKKKLCK